MRGIPLLAFGLFCPMLLLGRTVASAPEAPASKVAEDLKSAPDPATQTKRRMIILHRCLLECDWAKPMCEQFGGKECPKKHESCIARCRDEQALKKAMAQVPASDWGQSQAQAIEVCLPSGEHQFIRDLRCADGARPAYKRDGSVGPRNPPPKGQEMELMPDASKALKAGETDTHIVDRYRLNCGEKTFILFFDMYHCTGPKPWTAPTGFSRPLP